MELIENVGIWLQNIKLFVTLENWIQSEREIGVEQNFSNCIFE